ncbi:hypothetical protein C8Q77DRAFT_1135507 [Trametes polyzona]|nr:hypothetical protein C8Q77DRAFT_1135507 [Trametes polyzona]
MASILIGTSLDGESRFDGHTPDLDQSLRSSTSINSLPVEILAEIMLAYQRASVAPNIFKCWSCRSPRDFTDRSDWLKLPLVCRHWFSVASTNPNLWRWLTAKTSLSYLRTGLVRSGVTTIAVVVMATSAPFANETLDALIPHAHRLQVLILPDYHQEVHGVPLASLFLQYLPSLSTLVLGRDPSDGRRRMAYFYSHLGSMGEEAELLPSRFTRLDSLVLGGASVVLPRTITQQLRRLDISGWSGECPLLLGRLLSILRECVNVEELSIVNVRCSFISGGFPGDTNLAPPALPKLQTFVLTDIDFYVVHHILSTLRLPSVLTSVKIDWTYDIHTSSEMFSRGFFAPMPRDSDGHPLFPTLSRPLKSAFLTLRHRRHEVRAYHYVTAGIWPRRRENSSDPSLSMTVFVKGEPRSRPWPLLDDSLALLGAAPLEKLHLKLDAHMVGQIDWDAVFAAYPRLRALAVRVVGEWEESQARLFRSLHPTPGSEAHGPTVPCPGLRLLHLEGFGLVQEQSLSTAVREALEARAVALGGRTTLHELSYALHHYDSDEQYYEHRASHVRNFEGLAKILSYRRRRRSKK